MMVDSWSDWTRVLIFVISSIALILLIKRWWVKGSNWNVKTTDYWFALVMWCFAAWTRSLEVVISGSDFALTFVIIAAAVTVKGLLRKEPWGDDSAKLPGAK